MVLEKVKVWFSRFFDADCAAGVGNLFQPLSATFHTASDRQWRAVRRALVMAGQQPALQLHDFLLELSRRLVQFVLGIDSVESRWRSARQVCNCVTSD